MLLSDFRTDSDASSKMQSVSSSETSEFGNGSTWEILEQRMARPSSQLVLWSAVVGFTSLRANLEIVLK